MGRMRATSVIVLTCIASSGEISRYKSVANRALVKELTLKTE
jgi:hypothetical protein